MLIVKLAVLLLCLKTPATTSRDSKPVKWTKEDESEQLSFPRPTFTAQFLRKTQNAATELPTTFGSLADEVIEMHLNRENRIGSKIDAFLTSINTGLMLFSHVLHGCYDGWTSEIILESTASALDQLKISSDEITDNLIAIATWDNPLKNSTAKRPSICKVLVQPLKRIVAFLKGTQLWYLFLEDLSSALATYEVQNARFDTHRRTKLWDIAEAGNITAENLAGTLQVIYKEHNLVTLKSTIPTLVSSATQRRLEHLSGLLQESLGPPTPCERQGDKIQLKGTNVFLSEVLTCFHPGVNTVIFVATFRIFIDIDIHAMTLNGGKTFDVIVVSPQWIVVGGRTIDLSGPDREKVVLYIFIEPWLPWKQGLPRKPGLPGGNGGNFVGIFDRIFGVLKVKSHGGNGGLGSPCVRDEFDYVRCPGGLGGRPGLIPSFTLGAQLHDIIRKDQAEGTAGYPLFRLVPADHFELIFPYNHPWFATEEEFQSKEPKLPVNYIATALLDFKVSARLVRNVFFKPHLNNFVTAITNNTELASFQTTLDLVTEFHDLESQFTKLKEDPDLEDYYYDSITLRAYNSAVHSTSSNSTSSQDEQKTLLFLAAAALGRKLLLLTSNAVEPLTVFNMTNFLKGEIKRLGKFKQFSGISKITAGYNRFVDSKLDQLQTLVHTIILPEIDAIELKLNQQLGTILRIMKQFLKKPSENAGALRGYQQRMQKYQRVSRVFSNFKLLGNILGSFVPIAGHLMYTGIDFAANISYPKSELPQRKYAALPMAIIQGTKFAALRFNRENSKLLRDFLTQINTIELILKKEAAFLSEPMQCIQELKNLTESKISSILKNDQAGSTNQNDVHPFVMLLHSESFVKNSLRFLNGTIEKARGGARPFNITIREQKIQRVADIAQDLISAGSEICKKVLEVKINVKEVKYLIDREENDGTWFFHHQKRTQESLIPELNEILNFIRFADGDLSDKPKQMSEIIQWRLQSILRDAKLEFRKEYTEGTGIEEYMSRSLEKLEEACTTLIRLYGQLDTFRDQRVLNQFFVTLSSEFLNATIQDEKLRAAAAELQYLVRANAILERENIVRASYRAWLFPFGPPCQVNSTNTNTTDIRTAEKFEVLLSQVKESFNKMLIRVADGENTIKNKNIFKTEFRVDRPHVPFYTWPSSSYSRSISSLLEGKAVVLFANAKLSPAHCDGIKFQTIAPMFTSSSGDLAVDKAIEEALRDYAVTMRYLGNSHYRLGNSAYVIPSDRLELHFSFRLGLDGRPSIKNQVYSKLENGDFMQSPFTLWELKLEPTHRNVSSTALLGFKKLVDLNLVGSGFCMRSGHNFINYHPLSCED